MATVVFNTADGNSSTSEGLQDYFSLAPAALPAKDSFNDVSFRLRSPKWFLPKELHEGLSIPSCDSPTISHYYAEDEEDQIVFPIFSPLRFIGEVGNPIVTETPYTIDEWTTEDSGSDSGSDSDSDSDPDSCPDSDSLPSSSKAWTTISPPQSPQPAKYAEDDTAVRMLSTRSVDLFSHRWTVEEARSSRKEIRSNRGAYSNSVRLEYTLWRAWTKCMNNLRTVPPEKIRWEKDDGIICLYGPMAPASYSASERPCPSTDSAGQTSKQNVVSYLKPILKKRSMSEMMLERSLFNCSLLNRATVNFKAQQRNRTCKSRSSKYGHVTPIQKNRVQFI